ncbi:MAG: tyrosine-type recombinase/integrase [Nitrososphaeraceae archaeon]
MSSNRISAYISNVNIMSKSTAQEYLHRLVSLKIFVDNTYKISVDMLMEQIKQGSIDAYDILGRYGAYLKSTNNISNLTLKQRVVTVKNFLEYHDVDISPRKFKLKVKLPKVVRRNKEALSKEEIVNILNMCSDIRLKTYVMLLAATGMRAVEDLSIRIKDLDFQSYPPRLFVRGEFTKTRSDRKMFMTTEVRYQLSSWLDYKYRSR